jgi:hypothetical protein
MPAPPLLVAGHTDNVGADAVHVPLSQQRAEAVIAWLSAKGVDRLPGRRDPLRTLPGGESISMACLRKRDGA